MAKKTKKDGKSKLINDVPLNPTGQPIDHFGLGNIGKAIEAFEEHFAVGAVLLTIIGYIIISAFGEMKFAEYLTFLAIVFITYILFLLLSYCSEIIKNLVGEKLMKQSFTIGFFVLLLFIVIDKFEFFVVYSQKFIQLLNKLFKK